MQIVENQYDSDPGLERLEGICMLWQRGPTRATPAIPKVQASAPRRSALQQKKYKAVSRGQE